MENTAIYTPKRSYLGITSLLFSLAGFVVLPITGAIIGIITGAIALNKSPKMSDNFARAGIILGGLYILICVILVIITIVSRAVYTVPLS